MNNFKSKVIICGAAGRMGQQVARTVLVQTDMTLAGCVDKNRVGENIGEILFGKPGELLITDNLELLLNTEKPDVMVDFTAGNAAPDNIKTCVRHGTACVVGTTGISQEEMENIRNLCDEKNIPVLIAPNFSIGAVLMMKFAREAAKFYEWSEIIELHHEKKLDAPSGTALRTVQLMTETRKEFCSPPEESEKIGRVRGGTYHGVRIHSVRLPGLLAHQEVILGGLGETLTVRHDSLSRECFMPGIMMAIRKIRSTSSLTVGLENIM